MTAGVESATSLAGRVAVVTGGSRGIGREIAQTLAAQGAAVMIGYRSARGEADKVVESIVERGGRATSAAVDIRSRDQVEDLFDRVEQEFGVADIVVANAGSSLRHSVLETTDAQLETTLDIVVIGTFRTLQTAAARLLSAHRPGRLLAIGSIHAEVPFPNALAYNVSKAGMHILCRTMAGELIKDRVLVNVLVPGLTDTPGERAFRTEAELAAAGEALPMGRMGSPAEVAQLAAFLVSDQNSYMSGTVVTADGGLLVSLGLPDLRSNPSL